MDHAEYLKSLGGVIKLLRIYRKKTQLEVAFNLGINDRTLRRYEEGRKNMTLEMLAKITEYFELTPLELVQFVTQFYQKSSKKRSYADLFCYCHTRLFILKHPHISIIQTARNLITRYGEHLFFNRKNIISKLSCPVLELDINIMVSWLNHAALKLVGCDPTGKDIENSLVKRDPNETQDILKQIKNLLQGEASMGYSETNFETAFGKRRIAQVQFSSRYLNKLKKPLVSSFLMDVTDFRRAEILIAELYENQYSLDEEKPILIIF